MKIEIKGKEITLENTLRAHLLYESLQAENYDDGIKTTPLNSMVAMMYCNILAMIQKHKLDITLTYDEYMNWLDDNDPMTMIGEYSKWYADVMSTQRGLSSSKDEDVKKKKTTKKKTS